MAKIIEVIYAESLTGHGTEDNPARILQQLWSKSGILIAEYDPYTQKWNCRNLGFPFFE